MKRTGDARSSSISLRRIASLLAVVAFVSLVMACVASMLTVTVHEQLLAAATRRDNEQIQSRLKESAGIRENAPTPPTSSSLSLSLSSSSQSFDIALVVEGDGVIRLRLLERAVHACAYIKQLLAVVSRGSLGDATHLREGKMTAVLREAWDEEMKTHGLHFYRAEPRPDFWASTSRADSAYGGRWGPPYALLQGSMKSVKAASLEYPVADGGEGARPPLARGHVAWAGGGGGPDFFIALAEHPEWGIGHTVFAEVLRDDMKTVDKIMARPLRAENWNGLNVTVLAEPVPFALMRP